MQRRCNAYRFGCVERHAQPWQPHQYGPQRQEHAEQQLRYQQPQDQLASARDKTEGTDL